GTTCTGFPITPGLNFATPCVKIKLSPTGAPGSYVDFASSYELIYDNNGARSPQNINNGVNVLDLSTFARDLFNTGVYVQRSDYSAIIDDCANCPGQGDPTGCGQPSDCGSINVLDLSFFAKLVLFTSQGGVGSQGGCAPFSPTVYC